MKKNPGTAKKKSLETVTLGSVKERKNKDTPSLTKGSCSLGPYDWFWGCSCERVKQPGQG